MSDKVVVLGWGSLIWDPRDLMIEKKEWENDGPQLPIEFARISTDKRLTLVIYEPYFEHVHSIKPVLWNRLTTDDFDEAVNNLMMREKMSNKERIGFINLIDNTSNSRSDRVSDIIRHWMEQKGIKVCLWTDLASNFFEKTKSEYSLENAKKYIKSNLLYKADLTVKAINYIINTPKQIETINRQKLLSFITDDLIEIKSLESTVMTNKYQTSEYIEIMNKWLVEHKDTSLWTSNINQTKEFGMSDYSTIALNKMIKDKNHESYIWNAIFLSSYSFFEYLLYLICDQFDRMKIFNLRYEDVGKRGVIKSIKYLNGVVGMGFNEKSAEWQEIMVYNKIRNNLMHNFGVLNPASKTVDRKIIDFLREGKERSMLTVLTENRIYLNYNNVMKAFELFEKISNDLLAIAEKKVLGFL